MQHDYIIDDADGVTFLADLNDMSEAIVTLNSGTTAPSVTYAYMLWADTSALKLKMRNGANTNWVILGDLGSVGLGMLARTGGQMAGLLQLDAGSDIASGSTVDLGAATGNDITITHSSGTTAITSFGGATDIQKGARIRCRASISGGTLTITYNATSLKIPGAASITLQDGMSFDAVKISDSNAYWTIENVTKADGTALIVDGAQPAKRQTILSGPVDSSGLPNFGGSTGTTTVTVTGTLIGTAANGNANRTGSIVNPSWTGLNANGTRFLYLDIAADGSCTTGSTALEPTYRAGGSDVTTNDQFTFNVGEMVGKVGNGSVATQTYRVFVGEVTIAANVVSAITWYALRGRYDSGLTNTLPSAATQVRKNSNLGVAYDIEIGLEVVCLTANLGYATGESLIVLSTQANANYVQPLSFAKSSRNSVGFTTGGNAGFTAPHNTTGVNTVLTAANWAYRVFAERRW
jgi:hypothetical protein